MLSDAQRASLLELTGLPTAAGREDAVHAFLDRWLAERPDLTSRADAHGNREISFSQGTDRPLSVDPPIYFTAHLDHPAFVVDRVVAPTVLECAFRGGVMDDYFENAAVELCRGDARIPGVVTGRGDTEAPDKSWIVELDEEGDPEPGDIVRWRFEPAEIVEQDLPIGERGEMLWTNACDDLAAAWCALEAMDRLRERRSRGEPVGDARLLFTVAEEVGFIGAIGASRDAFIEKGARVIALETSRSFADSPIGGGPIVRVGDRLSIFTPQLTAAVAKAAENLAGAPATPKATEKRESGPRWRWQRKLMAGGACEASVFCAYGYDATCVCLPLGNYHNMADLDALQAKANTSPPRPGREHIAVADAEGLIDLLEACAVDLPPVARPVSRFEKLFDERRAVLGPRTETGVG
ncbi:MAG: hypothetical protein AAFU70_02055 [Planctomycetota bacterium]